MLESSNISFIVGIPGFEPGTPCSQSRCANRTALHPVRCLPDKLSNASSWEAFTFPGGMDGTRTRDPLRDRQVF